MPYWLVRTAGALAGGRPLEEADIEALFLLVDLGAALDLLTMRLNSLYLSASGKRGCILSLARALECRCTRVPLHATIGHCLALRGKSPNERSSQSQPARRSN